MFSYAPLIYAIDSSLDLMDSALNGREINRRSGFEPCRAGQETELYSYSGSLRGLEGE